MDAVLESISALFESIGYIKPDRIEKLPQSGSDRTYYRIYFGENTYIATHNENRKETQTFVYFSRHFLEAGLPVPAILAVNDNNTIYIQEDLGTESLLNKLEEHGHGNYAYSLFQKSLAELARIQILGDKGLSYDYCLTAKEFGKQAIMSDLLYFKYYFLDTLQLPYDKQAMLDDFDALSTYLTRTENKYFMFRDFQSRNIIVKEDTVKFIDYQGGMKGALQYDVASLLWQAKAELSETWKDDLLTYYMDCIDQILDKPVDRITFVSQYNGYVLIRLLQVMGAYGFRGLFERKAHFLASIPLALKNLKFFLDHKRVGIVTPEFDRVLHLVVADDMRKRFESTQANEQTPLVIEVNSFSYKKGIPADPSENGGGFVFDMRGILNPGRFDEYKTQSGRDKPVQDFLEQRTKMNKFLNSVWDLIDITVEDYLQRGFKHLMINFGCTGGQHRSVYAAEQTARHLRNKYKVKVKLEHTNEANWLSQIKTERFTHIERTSSYFMSTKHSSAHNTVSMKAMIFAAGLGSRLKPWTDHHPKALAVVNSKSLLQRNIEYLQSFGIFDVIVNVHHFADQIKEAINRNKGWGSHITISDETDEVLETGGGLKKAAAYFKDVPAFVVMNVDILTDLDLNQMIQQHLQTGALATLAVSKRETSRYFLFDDAGKLSGWRNNKTGEEKIVRNTTTLIPKAFSGIHVISAPLLGSIKQTGKFSMVDLYLDLARTELIKGFDHTGAKMIDVGKPESILKAETLFQ